MLRKWSVVILTLVILAFMVGCATESGTYSPERSAGAGALGGSATGAAVGSIIGAATGSAGTGAWVGAAAGGVLGGVGGLLYAEHRNSEMRSAQAAAQTYNYNPSQGNIVQVDTATASPSMVAPGQRVNLGMTYTILSPTNTPSTVTLVREVHYAGNLVGQPYQTTVTNANGTFSDSVAYALPSNATRGTYTVTERVVSNYGTGQKDTSFTVQ